MIFRSFFITIALVFVFFNMISAQLVQHFFNFVLAKKRELTGWGIRETILLLNSTHYKIKAIYFNNVAYLYSGAYKQK